MDDDREDADREAILRRRNRLIAVALSGLVSGATQACACLSIAAPDSGTNTGDPDGGAGRDAGSHDAGSHDAGDRDDAGLSQDGGPSPCLAPLRDAGSPDDAGAMDDAGSPDHDAGTHPRDAGTPVPCLAPPPSR